MCLQIGSYALRDTKCKWKFRGYSLLGSGAHMFKISQVLYELT